MRQAVTNHVIPAERNALWDRHMDWSNYCFKLLKDLSYEVVLEKFTSRFYEVMNMILKLKKYVDESLSRYKILALPAPEQVLTHRESMIAAQTEARTSSAQILAN